MENKEEKVVLAASDKVVHFNLPEWDKAIADGLKKSPLYTLSSKQAVLKNSADMVMLDRSITTNGWDMVSICRVSALNAKIRADKSYPASIDEEDYAPISLKGDFDAWQVVTGGDGRNVKLNIPMANGYFHGANMGSGEIFDVTGVSVDVLVKLQYFPLVSKDKQMDPGDYNLSVKTDSDSKSDPIVAVINVDDPSGKIDPINLSILKGQFDMWLNKPENLAQFNTIFATVMINQMGEIPDEFKWLIPSYTSYAYTDLGDEESSIFGVLCMTNNADPSKLPNQLPAISLEAENNALFVLSREALVREQILPNLPLVFEGSTSEDFSVDDTGLIITAKNIKLDSVRYGLIDYYPELKDFEIAFDENFIMSTSKIDTEISPGIVCHTTIVTKQTLYMDYNDNGEKIMAYKELEEAQVTNDVEVAPGIIITEIILGIIGAVIALIAAAIGGLVAFIVVGIIVLLVVGAIAAIIHGIIAKVIADGIKKAMPSIDPMVKVAAGQVKWPFCCKEGLDLTDIVYAGSITFVGNLDIEEQFQLQNGRLICA